MGLEVGDTLTFEHGLTGTARRVGEQRRPVRLARGARRADDRGPRGRRHADRRGPRGAVPGHRLLGGVRPGPPRRDRPCRGVRLPPCRPSPSRRHRRRRRGDRRAVRAPRDDDDDAGPARRSSRASRSACRRCGSPPRSRPSAASSSSAQALGRLVAASAVDQPALSAMGLTRPQRTVGSVAMASVAIAAGALAVPLVAWAASGLFPRGAAALAEPDPGLRWDVSTLAAGAALTLVAASLVLVLVAAAASGPRPARRGQQRATLRSAARPAGDVARRVLRHRSRRLRPAFTRPRRRRRGQHRRRRGRGPRRRHARLVAPPPRDVTAPVRRRQRAGVREQRHVRDSRGDRPCRGHPGRDGRDATARHQRRLVGRHGPGRAGRGRAHRLPDGAWRSACRRSRTGAIPRDPTRSRSEQRQRLASARGGGRRDDRDDGWRPADVTHGQRHGRGVGHG